MGETLRGMTPLVLLGLCLLVWLEPVLPGSDAIAARFGESAVQRFVLGLLCLFMLVSVLERQQLRGAFGQILASLKQIRGTGGGAGGDGEAASDRDGADPQVALDAMRILIAALGAEDPRVRENAAKNLERMTGQKFGEDAPRWSRYADELAKPS